MQHPYGYGLLVAPDGFKPKLVWLMRRAVRTASIYLLRWMDLFGWRIKRIIWVKDRRGQEVSNYRVIHSPQSIDITRPGDAEFLQACSNYSSGVLKLGEVFVCEVSPALYYPALGLVANESFKVFGDSILLPHRFHLSEAYRSVRPLRVARRTGPVSSIQRIDAYNFWHWMADCLPQLLTLETYMEGRPLTLLASDNLGGFQRETLALMLPPTMSVEFVPAKLGYGPTDSFCRLICRAGAMAICRRIITLRFVDESHAAWSAGNGQTRAENLSLPCRGETTSRHQRRCHHGIVAQLRIYGGAA